ncbi:MULTISPECIES: hypothetical protein [unclassified Streptomyces]|uniref:hypothetical protein n=1 Tax=unclassified Streptomyces TaxID=2593676 RepID=UPI000A1EB5E7|nr:hypothetical protein [Streptomyces sp. 13-12-16]OSP44968.1 hypothetical protein B7767_02105 [Streptomyces sp. 13-12-16]
MTPPAGAPFDLPSAVSVVETALSSPLPASGPTTDEGEPLTGEWTSTRGEGFLLLPLWRSTPLTGVYGREWSEAEERAESHLAALTSHLDAHWGPHRTLNMRAPLLRRGSDERVPEPFRTLSAKDCYGDLALWGPLPTRLPSPRWAALSLNQSDGDAPLILTALITDHPLTEPPDPAS